MIDATKDDLVTLGDARHTGLIPKRGSNPVSKPTVWRWVNRGICGVKLEVVHVGREPMTTAAAINEFFHAVTAAKQAKSRRRQPAEFPEADELEAAGLV